MVAPLITVSEALSFDEAALKAYLSDHLEGFSGDLQVRQFNAGQSNPTYQLSAGGRKYVLRKKPRERCCLPPMRWIGNTG